MLKLIIAFTVISATESIPVSDFEYHDSMAECAQRMDEVETLLKQQAQIEDVRIKYHLVCDYVH